MGAHHYPRPESAPSDIAELGGGGSPSASGPQFFPNPSHPGQDGDIITFRDLIPNSSYDIRDLTGKRVTSVATDDSGTAYLNKKGLSTGIYLLPDVGKIGVFE